nr:EOG090X07NA [Sida crystallina]
MNLARVKVEKEDDPVVQEMPIYLSKGLLEKLYVFQYPLRSVSVPCEKTKILSSRIKPKLQEIELEVEVPTQTPYYDRSKGEQIVINCDGTNKHVNPDDQNFFQGTVMDKIIYSSAKGQLDPSRYAVAIISKNELHLNPVHGILHVKPSFQYLDKSDKNLKKSGLKAKDDGDPDTEGEEDQPQQVMVKFGRTESDRLKKAREKSFGFLQKKNAEELWVPTEFHSCGTEKSMMERNRLLTDKPNDQVSVLSLSKPDYVSSLISLSSEEQVEQVRCLMLNVNLISFSRICSVLKISGDNQQQQLLRSLQHVATLVQGNWVVKSDVLYPKDKMCGVTGINYEIITKARDHVVCASDLPNALIKNGIDIITRKY